MEYPEEDDVIDLKEEDLEDFLDDLAGKIDNGGFDRQLEE